MKYTSFFILILLEFSLFGQNKQGEFEKLANAQSVREELGNIAMGSLTNSYISSSKYAGIQGHPFLSETWASGKLITNDKNIVKTDKFKFKFQIYNNELWMLFGKDSIILNSGEIEAFEISHADEKLLFEKCPPCDPKNLNNFYLKIFEDQHYKVYRHYSKKLVKANYVEKGMYSSGNKYDSFTDDFKQVFIVSVDGKAIKVKDNLKNIMEGLSVTDKNTALSFGKRKRLDKNLTNAEIFELFSILNKHNNK
jgi:hypothetical protein